MLQRTEIFRLRERPYRCVVIVRRMHAQVNLRVGVQQNLCGEWVLEFWNNVCQSRFDDRSWGLPISSARGFQTE